MLVALLKGNAGEPAAELAAVALRNLCLQNRLNKDAIVAADGLLPLIQLLSSGRQLLAQTLQCEVSGASPNCQAYQPQSTTQPRTHMT